MSAYDTFLKQSGGSSSSPASPSAPNPSSQPSQPAATSAYAKYQLQAGVATPPSPAAPSAATPATPAVEAQPNVFQKASGFLSDWLVNKPIGYLGDKLYNAAPKYFDEVGAGLNAIEAEGKKNAGNEILKTLQQGERAISGLTGGIISPKTQAPDNIVSKIYGGFSEAIGSIVALKGIGEGLSALTDTPKITAFLAERPLVYKYALPYIQNAVGFSLYGQLDPALGTNLVDRAKKLGLDIATSVPYTLLGGVKSPKVAIPASFALGFGMAKMSGASNEDAFISGVILGGLDAYSRYGGMKNSFIDGRTVEKKLTIEAMNTINKYAETKVTAKSTPEEIKKAYRQAITATHPDKTGGSDIEAKKVNAAYTFLTPKGVKAPVIETPQAAKTGSEIVPAEQPAATTPIAAPLNIENTSAIDLQKQIESGIVPTSQVPTGTSAPITNTGSEPIAGAAPAIAPEAPKLQPIAPAPAQNPAVPAVPAAPAPAASPQVVPKGAYEAFKASAPQSSSPVQTPPISQNKPLPKVAKPVQEGPKKYPTIHQGGVVKMVEGEPVKIIEGVETFAHKGDGGWIVSESSTGRFLAESASKEGAIAKAKFEIGNIGKEKFIKLLAEKKLKTDSKPEMLLPKEAKKAKKDLEKKIKETDVTPENKSALAKDVSNTYYDQVLKPRMEKGEAVVIGSDDLKDYFGKDYNIKKHPVYSEAADNLFRRAVVESKEDTVKFLAGGTGSGKSDFLVPNVSEEFPGVVYDSTAWNPEGLLKQIEFVQSKGKKAEVYGIIPNLERSRAYTFLREAAGKHPVTEAAFVNTHAGAIQTMLEAIKRGVDVYVLDTRTITSAAQAEDAEQLPNPVALLESVKYSKEYVREKIKDVTAQNAEEIIAKGKDGAGVVPQENRPDQGIKKEKAPAPKPKEGLQLEVQPKPTAAENPLTTEVKGETVPRFGYDPEGLKRFQYFKDSSKLKPLEKKSLLTKADLKTIFINSPEFKKNPVLTVTGEGDVRMLSFTGNNSKFSLNPNALGLVEKNLNIGDQIAVSRETLANDGTEFRVIKYDGQGGSSRYASIGRYRDDTNIALGQPELIKPIEFPELVALAKELSGNVPFIKKYTKANGMFYGKNGGEIGLNPDLFLKENSGQFAKTLAHEIGHLIDYLPDETLSRGNLLGRLNTLRGFLKDFYAPAGASRTNEELKTQLWELSKYWKPIDEATARKGYLDYRKSAAELYADFISVLFNDPRTVTSIAPTAYNIFFQQLDAKPEVKKAYFELQDFLRNGDKVAARRESAKQMFKTTEQEARERQIQNEIELEAKRRSIWFKFKHEFVDITEAVKEQVKKDKKAGIVVSDNDNPQYYLEERNYLGGKLKAMVEEKFNSIYQELQKQGLSWEDLGELMFYERILKGDRQEIANPLGFQPDFVKALYEGETPVPAVDNATHTKGMSDMKSTIGADKFAVLQKLADEYRTGLRDLFKQGRAAGLYTAEQAKMFDDNAFYVPFKGAAYSGVTKTTSGIKMQKGTLGGIENPANTGIEKGLSIMKAIERNIATQKTVDYFKEFHGDEVIEAPKDQQGYPIEPRDKTLGLVTYMKDGKVQGFHVDKYVADAIKKDTVSDSNVLISTLRFANSGLFRPLFITFNLGFQGFNSIRDFKRFWKNVPDMTFLKGIKAYAEAARAAKIRAFGLPENPSKADLEANALIQGLEKNGTLGITYNDIARGEDIEEKQIDRILQEVGIRESTKESLGIIGDKLGVTKKSPIIKQLVGVLDFIENLGNMVETLPKVAGVKFLEGKMEPRELRSFVRKYVGSPDFNAGGKFKKYSNEIFLFSNAIAQGIRSDFEIATDPKTRGGYWYKTAKINLLPKFLMLLASLGLLGETLKEIFGKISEYDKTNYDVIPLGIDQNGKAVYIRIPPDETGKIIGGMMWKVANAIRDPKTLGNAGTYGDLINYAGGQVPSITPVATTLFNIQQFVAGNNPYDFFRNRPVLSDQQMQAGGSEALKPFAGYLFEQMGGGVFAKLYSNETVPKNQSLSEKFIGLPIVSNVAGRFIKTSNYGETEQLKKITDEVKSVSARESLANKQTVYDYVSKAQGKQYGEVQALKHAMIKEIYNGLPKTAEDRTQAKALEKRFEILHIRGTADPRLDALLVAASNDQKVALLQEYQKTMTAGDFAALKKFIITNRVVSSDVFQKLIMLQRNPQ